MQKYKGLVIADDITGALDTGHSFAKRGLSTVVVSTPVEKPRDADVLVVNTATRSEPPSVAQTRVTDVLSGVTADTVYKKVDSTLRGNVVAEIHAAMAATDLNTALIAPGFPANDRTTVEGLHLADGTAVTDSFAGDSAEGSAASSSLIELFETSFATVDHVALTDVASPASVHSKIDENAQSDGRTAIICDCTRQQHLEVIAEGGTRADVTPLYVGSAGLASFVRTRSEAKPVLGVVGSVNETTFAQLAQVPDDQIVALDTSLALREPERAIDTTVERLLGLLAGSDGSPRAVVTAAQSPDEVERTLSEGRENGFSDQETRARIADALGSVSAVVRDQTNIEGIFVTGGAVASEVLDSLDADHVELTGAAVDTGVPVGRVIDDRAEGTLLVSKAGDFGDKPLINRCLRHLSRTHE